MPEDQMRYDQLAQGALRGVVREALRRVQRQGLPGVHHFYIAFNTKFPGVSIGPRLVERYPREMTVVLQHQFWNLVVTEDRFEVELSFDNIPEKLIVPFNSVKGFLDPHVQFGLQFEAVDVAEETADIAAPPAPGTVVPEGSTTEPVPPAEGQPNVVSLDAFRKK